MSGKQKQDRQQAIERYLAGESVSAICASMGYSRVWLYKWLERYESGQENWADAVCRRPRHCPRQVCEEIEQSVVLMRLSLYNRGLFCGAQAIRWELEELGVRPLPALRTIGRILARHALTHRRTGRYEPKGKRYPALPAQAPGEAHQTDFVGPCYLRGGWRFYSLNSVDVATGRCASEPLCQRAGQATIDAFWASWQRLGMPRHQQVDNEALFYGSRRYPRGMGSLIRLCLHYQIEPWFIPPAEPWRNGVVEQFNRHWRQKFLQRIEIDLPEKLHAQSLAFEQRHNSQYRYSKLGGKTPLGALQASKARLRFPPHRQAPQYPLPKPERGRYHLIRFVRSDGGLDVFGERFAVPPQAIYEYVRATVDVEKQILRVYLDGQLIDEHCYPLR